MTQTTTTIDLTGRPTCTVVLKVDRPTRRAILEMLTEREQARRLMAGEAADAPLPDFAADIPAEIVLHLREATFRDQRRWAQERERDGISDPVRWTARLLQDRAEADIDLDVLTEVVMGMDEATVAQMQQAYVSGVMLDPKVLGTATAAVKARMSEETLSRMGEALRFSPPTTESDPGNATG